MNLQIIEPQKYYFEALNAFVPGLVHFIEAADIEKNVDIIMNTMPTQTREHTYSIELYDYMVDWLREHKASQFRA
ncbi:hypothetical protein FHS15_000338 [Paenibacillus castaneae]|uniref:hypothetical protein n=1 Tax=Paenibacillus castaneae TaxID=474957 RepID=UPI001FBAED5A|nr:hypothetical protein [Paenibacillus castaneae]NIK75240.1 hypothetical protein [Paenibacillus castaneae]